MKIEEKKSEKHNRYLDALLLTIATLLVVLIMGFPQVFFISLGFFIMSLFCFGIENVFLATGIILLIIFIFTFCVIYYYSLDKE